MTSSVATAINDQGQVVGYSYTSVDTLNPLQGNSSTQGSFRYINGQLTLINPTGGLATSINDSGQVVGGNLRSINDSGIYVNENNPINGSGQAVSANAEGAVFPGAINNRGEIIGFMFANTAPNHGLDSHPGLLANGRITDLLSYVGVPKNATGTTSAINQRATSSLN